MAKLEGAELPQFHVQVTFGPGIPGAYKGHALLMFEKMLRDTMALPVEVFLETAKDQNKLRRLLTKDDAI